MTVLHDDEYSNVFSPLKPAKKTFFDENSYAPPVQLEFNKEKVIDIKQNDTTNKPLAKKEGFGDFSFSTDNAFKAVKKVQIPKKSRCLNNIAYREFMVDEEGVIVTIFNKETRYIRITPEELKQFISEARSLISGSEDCRFNFHSIKKEKKAAMKHLFIASKLCGPEFHYFFIKEPKTFVDDVIKLINEMHTYNVCYKFGKKRNY